MRDITKYQGIIPAFYACYEEDGSISTERTKALAEHLLKKGVKGVYVGGSSGIKPGMGFLTLPRSSPSRSFKISFITA